MIQAENLTMDYGPVRALDDVSFSVQEGEIVGLLGPNGAGKSTTMKILTTYLYPTSGRAVVGGVDVLEKPVEVRRRIGYLPEILPLYMDMEVKGYLNFVAQARGLSGTKLRERTDMVLDETGLRPMYRKVIRELSKGYKQRTALAQALIHDPDIIILDEPTSGLDPHQIIEIRELIRKLADGRTVMLSTHILGEVEATADRILIINRGRIAGDGTLPELREQANPGERARVAVKGEEKAVRAKLTTCKGVTRVEFAGAQDGFVRFDVYGDPGSELWSAVGALAQAEGWQLRELADRPLTLEETFLALTEPSAGAPEAAPAAAH
jgi:ABC-2 type transport system ATP-binding protein